MNTSLNMTPFKIQQSKFTKVVNIYTVYIFTNAQYFSPHKKKKKKDLHTFSLSLSRSHTHTYTNTHSSLNFCA